MFSNKNFSLNALYRQYLFSFDSKLNFSKFESLASALHRNTAGNSNFQVKILANAILNALYRQYAVLSDFELFFVGKTRFRQMRSIGSSAGNSKFRVKTQKKTILDRARLQCFPNKIFSLSTIRVLLWFQVAFFFRKIEFGKCAPSQNRREIQIGDFPRF